MTFSRPRSGIGNNKSSYELNRYSTSQIVVGGMGKLFKHFTRNFECSRIKTYADRRWSKDEGNAYEKIGMSLENISGPNYWYTFNYQERKHRFNFTKSRLVEEYDASLEKNRTRNHERNGIRSSLGLWSSEVCLGALISHRYLGKLT